MNRSIHTILIANRGEVALRIMRTCHAMGISTVAVFSDADATAPHVAFADRAVRIGPAAAAESYLSIDRILAAATTVGAGAIHPGYGFLAENADFAAACESAGIAFIGPAADTIRVLGKKVEAKRHAEAAGVPIIPGAGDSGDSDGALADFAASVGFPVLIKASAGGGGKGMRICREAADLKGAIESARREAEAAFGDGTLLIERYFESSRHVEIQILGDDHGNVVHLGERECSIQRRHQKIIEESPAPALDPETRAEMTAAALRLARALSYRSAGTVEMLVAPDGAFYFLEVNTRLQVEHPVTEAVTGIDIVREQIRIAEGWPLSFAQDDIHFRGAAIEARLYAEDPARNFLPATGTLHHFRVPEAAGIRVDAGIVSGSEVSIHYDPMIAKVTAWAPTRTEAARTLARTLRQTSVHGVVTNRALLAEIVDHPAFLAGDTDTRFLTRHRDDLAIAADPDRVRRAAVAATLWQHQQRRQARTILPAMEPGFRLRRYAPERVTYAAGDLEVTLAYENLGDGRFRIDGDGEVRARWPHPRAVVIEDARGLVRRYAVNRAGDSVQIIDAAGATDLIERPRFVSPNASDAAGSLRSPMPGRVIKVLATCGQTVAAGEPLVVLEAMKMEHTVTSPDDGVVENISVSEGDQVEANAILAVVTAITGES
ncbi:MAG TPA: acetyl-CoA carboxylase biotin carboxylase subunit [Kofleriaceae bacterium]|nr:acetyl-CoA carboxylase biotin carboxylase subunit [Kofleriaceae bacterium]